MPTNYTIGQHFEAFIDGQLASGRYGDASEVVREALRLMEEREHRLASLDAAIGRGLADIDAGRVHEADDVFDDLEAELAALPELAGCMKVIFSAQAKAELRDIALYIARDNRGRAQSFVRELRQRAKDIANNPLAFPVVPRFAHLDIRRRVYRDYLIFYRRLDDALYIVHIMHGARDYESVLLAGR